MATNAKTFLVGALITILAAHGAIASADIGSQSSAAQGSQDRAAWHFETIFNPSASTHDRSPSAIQR